MSDFIRDLDATKKFADDVDDYNQLMRKNCDDLEKDLDVLEACIKDELGKEAVAVFSDLIESIRADLPEAEEIVRELRRSIKHMDAASTVRVRR